MNFIKHILTGKDNQTWDLGRVSWFGSFFAVIGAESANLYHGVAVDVQSLAAALGVVAGAHGAALWAKRDTEPQ